MNRIPSSSAAQSARRGFTLVELLVAAMLTLMLTALVVQMFAFVSEGVFNSRANIEMSDMLRNARERLIRDLRGTTAPTVPPLEPWTEQGYFECVEGPQVANRPGGDIGDPSVAITNTNGRWTVYGDKDDILMCTTADYEEPFVGKWGATANRAPVAEVAWFVLGNRLYRRVFLVNLTTSIGTRASYGSVDLSMRQVMGAFERDTVPPIPPAASGGAPSPNLTQTGITIANGLGDLTMRERRSLHQPYVWPYEMRYLGSTSITGTTGYRPWSPSLSGPSSNPFPSGTAWTAAHPTGLAWTTVVSVSGSPGISAAPFLGLPHVGMRGPLIDAPVPGAQSSNMQVSKRANSGKMSPFIDQLNESVGIKTLLSTPTTVQIGGGSGREADDIILSGVIGFDIKVWDPGAPIFRAPSPDGGSVGLLMPGDAGYGYGANPSAPTGALENFINGAAKGNSNFQPVGFGAYADLNYMWIPGITTTANEIRQFKYLQELNTAANIGAPGRSPAVMQPPSFGFATRGRSLSGFPHRLSNGSDSTNVLPAVYDTWSRHYEFDGIDNDGDGQVDEGTNGIDDNGNGFIDEAPGQFDIGQLDNVTHPQERWLAELNAERDAPPPYDAPLRGIKITIRVMEEDSRQVREVSVVHEFLPY